VSDGPKIDGHSGSVRVRSTVAFEAKQKIPYFLGVSGKTAGAKDLSLNLIVVPPKGKAEPHTHSEFESAVYVISGRAIHHWGDWLQPRWRRTPAISCSLRRASRITPRIRTTSRSSLLSHETTPTNRSM
jgi:uncharacterized RmlC-like cupin family protein